MPDQILDLLLKREQEDKGVYEPLKRATSIGPDPEAEARNLYERLIEGMGPSSITNVGKPAIMKGGAALLRQALKNKPSVSMGDFMRGSELLEKQAVAKDATASIFDNVLNRAYDMLGRHPAMRKSMRQDIVRDVNDAYSAYREAHPSDLPSVFKKTVETARNLKPQVKSPRSTIDQPKAFIETLMEMGYIPKEEEAALIMKIGRSSGDKFLYDVGRTFSRLHGRYANPIGKLADKPEFISRFRQKSPIKLHDSSLGRRPPMTPEMEKAKQREYNRARQNVKKPATDK